MSGLMNIETFWGAEILWKWDSSCRQSWIFKVDLIGIFGGDAWQMLAIDFSHRP
jgi:hypothetical protein